MNGLNKVIIMGNLGADPELRMAPGGLAVLKMRVATGERWQDKEGKWQDRTEWHRVTVFGKRAESLATFLRKGMFVTVDGQNRTTSFEKDGQKHFSTEVVAHLVWSPNQPRSAEMTTGAGSPSENAPFAPPVALIGGYGRAAAPAADIPF